MACWCNAEGGGHLASLLSALFGQVIAWDEDLGGYRVHELSVSESDHETVYGTILTAEVQVSWPWEGGAGPLEADIFQDLVACAIADALGVDPPDGVEALDLGDYAEHVRITRPDEELRASACGCADPERMSDFLDATWWKLIDGAWRAQPSPRKALVYGRPELARERIEMVRSSGMRWPESDQARGWPSAGA